MNFRKYLDEMPAISNVIFILKHNIYWWMCLCRKIHYLTILQEGNLPWVVRNMKLKCLVRWLVKSVSKCSRVMLDSGMVSYIFSNLSSITFTLCRNFPCRYVLFWEGYFGCTKQLRVLSLKPPFLFYLFFFKRNYIEI